MGPGLQAAGSFPGFLGFLTIGVTAWVAGFDMIYALQDLEFDRKHGLYSFPAKFGREASLTATHSLHVIALIAWALAGVGAGLSFVYGIGLVLVAAFLIRENYLARFSGLAKIQETFFTMNIVVSLSLFVVTLLEFSFQEWIS